MTSAPADITGFTPEQKLAFAQANSLGSGVQTVDYSAPGATLTSATFQTGATPQIPSGGGSTTPPTPPPIDFGVDQKKSDLAETLKQLTADYTRQGQSAQRQGELESRYVDPVQNRLDELSSIDAGYAADLSNIESQKLKGAVSQQGSPTSEVGRQINLKDLNYNALLTSQDINIKRATNAALISSTQGQLAKAEKYVQRALDLEFKPLEAKINYLKDYLSLNAKSLNEAEQNQLKYKLDQEQRAYDEGIKTKQTIYQTMFGAQKNGAPNNVLQQISAAKTPEEAAQAAGSYLQSTQIIEANGRKVMVNAAGTVVKDLGASKGPSSASHSSAFSKGRMGNKQFVELSLQRAGIYNYNDALAKVPPNKMGVIDNKTGQIGYIDPTEYSTALYTPL